MPADLDAIFKAYDIRGIAPDQLDPAVAEALGAAFARFAVDQVGGARKLLVARDMRPSGVELVAAFTAGVQAQGLDVVDLGLASTDLLYFAAGKLDAPGAMFTASHNPAQYNGLKLCLAGARPVGEDTGLAAIKALAAQHLAGDLPPADGVPGGREPLDLLHELRGPRAVLRRPREAPPAQGRGRHRQRDGRPRRARR